ncbi:MAG: hypothetical protein E4G94_09415 [ANME-2 cluster archaeon]|nr:MAG: hypothetical protein E4G94_09415 [ANME-2 cluster archaeon]
MANISQIEKLKLEKIFSMAGGYVLDFSSSSFQRFIYDIVKLDINNSKYDKYGSSKANRLRTLWEMEADSIVGKITEEMLLYYKAKQLLDDQVSESFDKNLFEECLNTAYKLQGKELNKEETVGTIEDFLEKEVDEISINALNIDGVVTVVLEQRIVEVKQCLNVGAPLSVIFLCGSILEGLLLGIATNNPTQFNQSSVCPKRKDAITVKRFHEWSLNNFIDVAHDIGFIGLDVKEYSHTLRYFRNYIHPYQQMSSEFNPDMHTAKISWQVLKAAMHDIYQNVK